MPAGPAKDYGLDRSMIIGYGQDDRVCAFTSFMSMLKIDGIPKRTSICMLVDKEEIGSTGATGMESKLFENFSAELLNSCRDNYSEIVLKRSLDRSYMLSADVTCAYDPNFPNETPKQSTAFLVKVLRYPSIQVQEGKADAMMQILSFWQN